MTRRALPVGGWIGVDLDDTLAHYTGWKGHAHIGKPIPLMVKRVKKWLAAGIEVRIVTARAADPGNPGEQHIRAWCLKHLGQELRVQAHKDFMMIELWDDRAVQVLPGTGERADGQE
jgi:hypothetical protein